MTKHINPLSQYDKQTPSELMREAEDLAREDRLTDDKLRSINEALAELGYKVMCFESYSGNFTPLRYGFKLFELG